MNVLIADDHFLVQKGLEVIVGEVLGSHCSISFASDGTQAINKLLDLRYDILIMDLLMPNTDGLELVSRSLKITPDLKILVVTINQENIFAPRYLGAGVHGFVNKKQSDEVLKEAILKISKGKRFISEELAETFANSHTKKAVNNPFDSLSTREFEVTNLLLKGLGAIEIANALSINTSTASSYRARVFAKLNIKNFMELVRLSRQFDILDDAHE
ncbi:response regulator transcription factor [Dyadobacter sp. CY312]|uniref:response regulator n=1 Tax=Dyadobacter sp. CY312 TaxID=2907303 RepID=UPI001F39FCFD|nr:response regulator transcription factor [Dyadobacter sp. CY312]MCE7044583.1 response regulator transcription factor [Dyadobacter sp. CY312]